MASIASLLSLSFALSANRLFRRNVATLNYLSWWCVRTQNTLQKPNNYNVRTSYYTSTKCVCNEVEPFLLAFVACDVVGVL